MASDNQNKSTAIAISIIVASIIAILIWYFVVGHKSTPPPVSVAPVAKVVTPTPPVVAPEPVAPAADTAAVETDDSTSAPEAEPEVAKNPLPKLDSSDSYVQTKLAALTWRKELLKLVINDDMIRRFVVFTDNFARGIVAYKQSPLVLPSTEFTAIDSGTQDKQHQELWKWDDKSTRRFSLYVDLLRSFDSETLVQWYIEMKPLINQAYAELGYPDQDFSDTLQQAITRVLDMEIPKQPLEVVRPSVMYKYADPAIEALPDTDKLMLRIGKENLLVIKSVLLEVSEKLSRAENG